MVKARYHRSVGFLSLPGPLLNRSTSLGSTPPPPPPRETDLQGIRTEAIGYREPDPPPDIYLASHSGSRPLDSLHKTFNRDGCRRNQFQVVRHVHIGLAVTDPTRDFHGGRCTSGIRSVIGCPASKNLLISLTSPADSRRLLMANPLQFVVYLGSILPRATYVRVIVRMGLSNGWLPATNCLCLSLRARILYILERYFLTPRRWPWGGATLGRRTLRVGGAGDAVGSDGDSCGG